MPEAWYHGRGSADVVVAVLDTGFRYLAIESPLDVLPGVDLVNNDEDPNDDNGHGTHIASTIFQSTDNGARAAGLAPDCVLLPVKVLNDRGVGTVRTVADGIYWATDQGADVINLSLSLAPQIVWSALLADAVGYASRQGVIVVAASGNHGAATVSLPARINSVIAVGAVDSSGARASYSNTGPGLDLVAPGGDTEDRDGDGFADGILASS